jgi:hypothetical protein
MDTNQDQGQVHLSLLKILGAEQASSSDEAQYVQEVWAGCLCPSPLINMLRS